MEVKEECREKAEDPIILFIVTNALANSGHKGNWSDAEYNLKVFNNLRTGAAFADIESTLAAQAVEIGNAIRKHDYTRLLDITEPTMDTIIDNMLEKVVACECKK